MSSREFLAKKKRRASDIKRTMTCIIKRYYFVFHDDKVRDRRFWARNISACADECMYVRATMFAYIQLPGKSHRSGCARGAVYNSARDGSEYEILLLSATSPPAFFSTRWRLADLFLDLNAYLKEDYFGHVA